MKKETSNKKKHPILQLLELLLWALILLIPSSISAALATGDGKYKLNQALGQILIFIIPVANFVYSYHRDDVRGYLKLDFSGKRWLYALAGCVVMMLLIPINEYFSLWNSELHFPSSLSALEEKLRQLQSLTEAASVRLLSGSTFGALVVNILVIAFIPAVCEELFFRAGVQNLMQQWVRNPHVAIWITAAFFSFIHGEVFSFLPRFLLGAILGYLYVYGGSILCNIAAHFFNNMLVVVLYFLDVRGVIDYNSITTATFPTVLVVCCTVAAVALMYAIFFMDKSSQVKKRH